MSDSLGCGAKRVSSGNVGQASIPSPASSGTGRTLMEIPTGKTGDAIR
ncbi:MAG: hypothetical protein RIE06_09170 [Roseibium album]|nr:hypothetical protein [Labrenzia sp. EL_142]MBG6203227.1 hypothetical protein [Labrenzia sp. EL_13]